MKKIILVYLVIITLTGCKPIKATPMQADTLIAPTDTLTPLPTSETSTPSPTAISTIADTPTQSIEEIMAYVTLNPGMVTIYSIYKGCSIDEYVDIESFPPSCVDSGQRSGDFLVFDSISRYKMIRVVIHNQSEAIPEEFFDHVTLQIFKYETKGDYSEAEPLLEIVIQGVSGNGDVDIDYLSVFGYSAFYLKLISKVNCKIFWEDSLYFFVPEPTSTQGSSSSGESSPTQQWTAPPQPTDIDD